MSRRNRESRVQRGQGGCKYVHVCTLHNEQSRYIAYLHSVIIRTWGQICKIYVIGWICDYNKGIKKAFLIRRQQLRRSYLSQVHLSHLSCTLITAFIWSILSIVLGLWHARTCHCFLLPGCLMFLLLRSKIEWNLAGGGGGGGQNEAGGTSEAGCARID